MKQVVVVFNLKKDDIKILQFCTIWNTAIDSYETFLQLNLDKPQLKNRIINSVFIDYQTTIL